MEDPKQKIKRRACGPCASAKRFCDLQDTDKEVCSRCTSMGKPERCVVLPDRRTKESGAERKKQRTGMHQHGQAGLSTALDGTNGGAAQHLGGHEDISPRAVQLPLLSTTHSKHTAENRGDNLVDQLDTIRSAAVVPVKVRSGKSSATGGVAMDAVAESHLSGLLQRDAKLTVSQAESLALYASAAPMAVQPPSSSPPAWGNKSARGARVQAQPGGPSGAEGDSKAGGLKRVASAPDTSMPDPSGSMHAQVMNSPVPTLFVSYDGYGRPCGGYANSAWTVLFGVQPHQLLAMLATGVLPRHVHSDDAGMHGATCMATFARQAPYQMLVCRFLSADGTPVLAQETSRVEYCPMTGRVLRMTLFYTPLDHPVDEDDDGDEEEEVEEEAEDISHTARPAGDDGRAQATEPSSSSGAAPLRKIPRVGDSVHNPASSTTPIARNALGGVTLPAHLLPLAAGAHPSTVPAPGPILKKKQKKGSQGHESAPAAAARLKMSHSKGITLGSLRIQSAGYNGARSSSAGRPADLRRAEDRLASSGRRAGGDESAHPASGAASGLPAYLSDERAQALLAQQQRLLPHQPQSRGYMIGAGYPSGELHRSVGRSAYLPDLDQASSMMMVDTEDDHRSVGMASMRQGRGHGQAQGSGRHGMGSGAAGGAGSSGAQGLEGSPLMRSMGHAAYGAAAGASYPGLPYPGVALARLAADWPGSSGMDGIGGLSQSPRGGLRDSGHDDGQGGGADGAQGQAGTMQLVFGGPGMSHGLSRNSSFTGHISMSVGYGLGPSMSMDGRGMAGAGAGAASSSGAAGASSTGAAGHGHEGAGSGMGVSGPQPGAYSTSGSAWTAQSGSSGQDHAMLYQSHGAANPHPGTTSTGSSFTSGGSVGHNTGRQHRPRATGQPAGQSAPRGAALGGSAYEGLPVATHAPAACPDTWNALEDDDFLVGVDAM